jgi:intracellular multiplication protein IcmD
MLHQLKKISKNQWFKLFLVVAGCLVTGCVFAQAAGASADVGTMAEKITGSFGKLGKLMVAVAYLAGFGFTITSIFKFKQHKDNPTQMPIGTPIALLAVGIVLIFLPGLIKTGGATVFGTEAAQSAGGFTGEGAKQVPGGEQAQ